MSSPDVPMISLAIVDKKRKVDDHHAEDLERASEGPKRKVIRVM